MHVIQIHCGPSIRARNLMVQASSQRAAAPNLGLFGCNGVHCQNLPAVHPWHSFHGHDRGRMMPSWALCVHAQVDGPTPHQPEKMWAKSVHNQHQSKCLPWSKISNFLWIRLQSLSPPPRGKSSRSLHPKLVAKQLVLKALGRIELDASKIECLWLRWLSNLEMSHSLLSKSLMQNWMARVVPSNCIWEQVELVALMPGHSNFRPAFWE